MTAVRSLDGFAAEHKCEESSRSSERKIYNTFLVDGFIAFERIRVVFIFAPRFLSVPQRL